MVTRKYERYVVKHPVGVGKFGQELTYTGDTDYKSNFTMIFLKVSEPVLMEDSPHVHDFDMYIYFLALDPTDMGDLGADIEIGLGAEQEIYKITTPTSVYIPAGMIHCPLNFIKVTKPLLFVHATLASKYYKLPDLKAGK
jgi:hypothetical protein